MEEPFGPQPGQTAMVIYYECVADSEEDSVLRAKPILAAAVIAAAAVLAGAACGGGDDDSAGSAVATPDASGIVILTARDVKFIPDKVTIPVGQTVELRLRNEDGQEHDLQIKDLEVEVMEGGATGDDMNMDTPDPHGTSSGEMGSIAVHTTANGEDSMTFIANEKGTYEFWCTISGHKEAGMVGTLTVE